MATQTLQTHSFESQFKGRQCGGWVSSIYFSVGTLMVCLGIWLLFNDDAISIFNLVLALLCFFLTLVLHCFGAAQLYCLVEDLGTSLRIKIGPFTKLLYGFGETIIFYNEIASYHPPSNRAEGCMAYSVGVNGFYQIRQMGICSCDCKQKQMVIELKSSKSSCGSDYKKISFSVNERDYEPLKAILDEKCGIAHI
eukprot:140916_1